MESYNIVKVKYNNKNKMCSEERIYEKVDFQFAQEVVIENKIPCYAYVVGSQNTPLFVYFQNVKCTKEYKKEEN